MGKGNAQSKLYNYPLFIMYWALYNQEMCSKSLACYVNSLIGRELSSAVERSTTKTVRWIDHRRITESVVWYVFITSTVGVSIRTHAGTL